MSTKKMGRPTNKPKDEFLQIRIDEETRYELNEVMDASKMSKSDVVRTGIKIQYNKLREKDR